TVGAARPPWDGRGDGGADRRPASRRLPRRGVARGWRGGRGRRLPGRREHRVGAVPVRRRPRDARGHARTWARRRRDGLGRSGGRPAGLRRTAPGLGRRSRTRGRPPLLLPPRDADLVVPLRQETWMIGTARRRRDGDAKVRGATRYVADMPVHG